MVIFHAERPARVIPLVVCFLNPKKWRRNRGDGDACGLRLRGRVVHVIRDAGSRTAVEWNGRVGPQLRPRGRSRALLGVLGAQRRKTIVCILLPCCLAMCLGGLWRNRFEPYSNPECRRSRRYVSSRAPSLPLNMLSNVLDVRERKGKWQ